LMTNLIWFYMLYRKLLLNMLKNNEWKPKDCWIFSFKILSFKNATKIMFLVLKFAFLLDCLFDGVKCHFQQYFSYIVAVSFIGGGNRRVQRKPPTCPKSLTIFIT
jgi:hypothetical protein